MKKYYIVSSIIMLLCLACAHYTAREQAMIFGKEMMKMHEELSKASLSIINDPNVPMKERLFVATKVNPKINNLHSVIVKYNDVVINSFEASPQDVTQYRTSIIELVREIKTMLNERSSNE